MKKQKKINLSLYLSPADALRVLDWVYKEDMITSTTHARKVHSAIAEFEIWKKTAEKDD